MMRMKFQPVDCGIHLGRTVLVHIGKSRGWPGPAGPKPPAAFLLLRLGAEQQKKTKAAKDPEDPWWDEDVCLDVPPGLERGYLRVEVWYPAEQQPRGMLLLPLSNVQCGSLTAWHEVSFQGEEMRAPNEPPALHLQATLQNAGHAGALPHAVDPADASTRNPSSLAVTVLQAQRPPGPQRALFGTGHVFVRVSPCLHQISRPAAAWNPPWGPLDSRDPTSPTSAPRS